MDYALSTPACGIGLAAASSSGNVVGLGGDFGKAQAKHKQFKLAVYGLNGEDEYGEGAGIQVKVTQDTTVQQVIEQVGAACDSVWQNRYGKFFLLGEFFKAYSEMKSATWWFNFEFFLIHFWKLTYLCFIFLKSPV